MSSYDARARATAARLLATIGRGGKGQAATLKSPSATTRNDLTGTLTRTDVLQSVAGVEIDFKAFEIDGSQVLASDRKFMMSALTVDGSPVNPEPKPSHRLSLGGADWLILSVTRLAPAGTAIYYELHLRGA